MEQYNDQDEAAHLIRTYEAGLDLLTRCRAGSTEIATHNVDRSVCTECLVDLLAGIIVRTTDAAASAGVARQYLQQAIEEIGLEATNEFATV